MSSFEDLEIWKRTRELRKKISILLKSFPAEEKYSLIDQIIRSSRSCTANIAEGYGSFTIRKAFSIADKQEVHYMKLKITYMLLLMRIISTKKP